MSTENTSISLQSIFYRDAPSTYTMRRHQHATWQWYSLVHGDVTQTSAGKAIELSSGDSVLSPPGSDRAPAGTGNAPSYVMALFTPGPLDLHPLAQRKMIIPKELQASFNHLVAELREPKDGHARLLIQSLTTHLLIGLLRHYRFEKQQEKNKSQTDSKIDSPKIKPHYKICLGEMKIVSKKLCSKPWSIFKEICTPPSTEKR